ncbi:dynamin family protein [Streptomyces umbrinus]|uniref:dynamin family protein n=1 Tax=Streptomyces umbrinus TaxID=67370 RepID=UPI0033CEBD50
MASLPDPVAAPHDEVFARIGHAIDQDDPAAAELRTVVRNARARMAQPMRVAVAGRLKCGKSTLVNALLGEEVSDTGQLELTFNVCECRRDGRSH